MKEKSLKGGIKKKGFFFVEISHLLVLRFLYSLVDVIEDLSAAICCLLHFVLLHCIVWKTLWHQTGSKPSLVLQGAVCEIDISSAY